MASKDLGICVHAHISSATAAKIPVVGQGVLGSCVPLAQGPCELGLCPDSSRGPLGSGAHFEAQQQVPLYSSSAEEHLQFLSR